MDSLRGQMIGCRHIVICPCGGLDIMSTYYHQWTLYKCYQFVISWPKYARDAGHKDPDNAACNLYNLISR